MKRFTEAQSSHVTVSGNKPTESVTGRLLLVILIMLLCQTFRLKDQRYGLVLEVWTSHTTVYLIDTSRSYS